ncbi:MAG TPA: 2-hydroxyacid dehydrogenase [Woeseiaceae bacterium]|nr:2-hydroxyacid dehydrogenase [Woeseiaceae bacterium]
MKVVLYGSPVIAFLPVLRARLSPEFNIAAVDYDATDDELEAAFHNAAAVVTVRYDHRIPDSESIRLVQVPGVGCDEIDRSLLPPEATLCNVYGHGDGVAEYAMLGMLQFCHQVFEADASFRAGSWSRSSRMQAPPHREMSGSTVGIVGFGVIGRALAEHLQGFNVTTLVCNRSDPGENALVEKFYALKDICAMASDCDFLIVSVPLVDSTIDLIDQDVFAAMKETAVLVNVARGAVVNEYALYSALHKKEIGGAVIDVWYNYPSNSDDDHVRPSKYDFARLENVLMTPHISGWTEGTVNRRWTTIVDNLNHLANQRELENVVYSPEKAV